MRFVRKSLVIPTCVLTILIYLFLNNPPSISDRRNIPTQTTVSIEKPPPNDNRVHWQRPPEKHPVTSFIPLPTGKPAKIPRIQYDFPRERSSDRKRRQERQAAVKEAFIHAWGGYKEHAWLKDEVAPISGGYVNTFAGWAATLVDALDTLLIMGLKDEFEKAVAALDQIDFTTTDDKDINVFETTIRYLGGLLAAHDLSDGKYPVLLKKAVEVAELLYGAFDTPNRMQMSRWEWKKSAQGLPIRPARNTLLAELGSLSLEFTRLTQLTGDPKYFDAIQRITDNLERAQPKTQIPGLWPMVVDAENLIFDDNRFTVGAMADSTYEYLPKEHLLLGGRTNQYQRMYEAAIEPIKKYLFYRPLTKNGEDILISGNVHAFGSGTPSLEPQAQHLTCFVGGMVGIAAKIFERPEELPIARKLVDGCIWAYDSMPTGVMPEVFYTAVCEDKDNCTWDEKKWLADVRASAVHRGRVDSDKDEDEYARELVKQAGLQPGMTEINDARYMLRPEAIESVFIMYRITGDKALQDAAWRMFQSIEKLARTNIAHAGIEDVRTLNTEKFDKMESFWLAETLKYFYLIFSEPSLISLDEYVFNTEAHPLKRPTA
ncbi:Mannosyl-oligosaccharide 1,2-alpha-mannosidase [Rasamsonia emersonii CBS 393.64]|uniref:alpha-1,2-Mannosidase n=1 Tax=Rasamsonia emersonii (strain ATCC 16479 / CBS 393.64 / IMI 116815) TaxID=1408163 RepID=A0A0F4YWF0_RASE3|nr:Mannosyl-oligosaccharide 1,2-alpha-mannosidase [Rasamsonia emersonii CBS 393.64]KKA22569.1 Mannosyl-oligosaccharide 1,2-alpha-mannosidase [Rasamsonia emersonii CBS 393.64]